MKVSVVIPVYNKAPFLQECLQSVLSQDLTDFELLAVDDGSTDESLAILRAVDDPRMRILATPHNLGPSGAMQVGVDAAVGEYIIRVDADDACVSGRFSRQVAFMDRHPELGLSGGALSLMHAPDMLRSKPLDHDACRAELLFGVAVHQPTAIFRRAALLASGVRFRDDLPRWGEDWMVQLELSEHTRFANLPDALVSYRVGEQNSGKGRDRTADYTYLMGQAFAHFGLPLEPSDLRYAFMVVKHFERPVEPVEVEAFRRWLNAVEHAGVGAGRLERKALHARLARAWDEICFHTLRFGPAVVLRYLRHDPRPSWPKVRYLLSSLISGRRYTNDDPS